MNIIKKHLNKIIFLAILLIGIFGLAQNFTQAAFTTGKAKSINLDTDSSLKGWWTFDGGKTGAGYTQDSTSNNNIATTTLITRSPGKVGQALGFNLANTPPTTSGLVGWWNMDRNQVLGTNLNDLSTSNNDGTITGATLVTGKIGQSLNFDGSDDGVAISGSTVYVANGVAYTASAWVKVTDFSPNSYPHILVLRSNTTEPWELILSDQVSYLGISIGSANDWAKGKSDTAAATLTNGWHHVAVTYSGGDRTVLSNFTGYLDGVSFSFSAAGGYSVLTQTSSIGSTNGAGGSLNFFEGAIDDVRVYNRALSASEVANLYRGSSYAQVSPSPLSTGLDTFTNTGLTVGSWVKYASSTGNQILLRKADTATSSNAYQLSSNGTNFQFLLGTTTSLTITGTTAVKPNVWYYVAGVADGTNMRLYVNGRQEASATQSGTTINTISPTTNNWGNSLFLGMDDSPTNFLVGHLDDPRVYARALSANEVYQLYTHGKRNLTVAKPKTDPVTLQSGLVGWWTFDGKDTTGGSTRVFLDRSVSAVIATSTTVTLASGKIAQGISLNGTNAQAVSNPSSVFNLSSSSFTTSARIKTTQTAFSTVFTIRTLSGSSNISDLVAINATANKASVYYWEPTDATSPNFAGTITINNGQWHMLTVTYVNGGLLQLYVDGRPDGSATPSGNTSNINAKYLTIGSNVGSIQFFNGSIDDLRVYNRALSANEIKQLYTQGTRAVTVAKPKPTPVNFYTSLVGHWTFDGKDCGLTYCVDKSGQTRTATLTSGAAPGVAKLGQGLKLDGVSNYVATGSFTVDSQTFSLSFWFYNNNNASGARYITKHTGWTDNLVYFGIYGLGGGSIRTDLYTDGTSPNGRWDTSEWAVNKWQLYTLTYDATTNIGTLYRDGISIGTNSYPTDPTDVSSPLRIGTDFDLGQYFNGRFDDVRLYSRVLSAGEVYQLYRLGL